jgi:hypothetical protein
MKNKNFQLSLYFFLVIGGLLFTITSCRYKVESTRAVIRVVDHNGTPIKFAKVRVFAEPSEFPPPSNALRFDTCGVTGTDGSVEFDFSPYYQAGQAGFAVLDVAACATSPSRYGEGIIKIKEQEASEETVTILIGASCLIPADCE